MSEDSFAIGFLGSFGLGIAIALLLVLLARPWSRRFLDAAGPRTRTSAIVALGVLASLSAALVAGPALAPADDAAPMAGVPAMRSGVTGPADKQAASSMDVATAALSARLASGAGTDADWDLLAQSFEFMGRSADAALARKHTVSTERSLQDAVAVSAGILGRRGPGMGAVPTAGPGEAGDLLAQAEEHRRRREFKQACEIYAVIAKRGAMTADSWADYADAQGSLAGTLAGEPARAIEAALTLDPRHAKALWLKASLAHEEGRYQIALATWERLLAIVPPGSSDARIVEANIAEAARLAST